MAAIEELPEPAAPDVIGEIVCWRAWDVVGEHSATPRLASPAHAFSGMGQFDGIWPTNRWMVAECPRGHSVAEIPNELCSCGLYAANTLEELLGMGYGRLTERGKVIGEVGFAGRVEQGANATRAQRGRVIRLWVPFTQGDLGERLGRVYNVPVEFGAWWATDPRLR